MLHPPQWISGHEIEEVDRSNYEATRQEFMSAFKEEERRLHTSVFGEPLSSIVEQGWNSGAFWYSIALTNPTGLYHMLHDHLLLGFPEEHREDGDFLNKLSAYWAADMNSFVQQKIEDKAAYDKQLQEEFDVQPTDYPENNPDP
ncbi:hypothetical protein LOZ12_000649 [Ophidiomyces ophidiicola]|uniref:Uncharacterized protein n=1 Tax=Ophidiomyces ophidiicola TaxID=1387563 RepID=A0ACB8V0T5_9EURO|nr:uncharacterized protein LOZ57_000092 [Ophidiomyces ophidiicola]KAI1915794.1 hypothetical protein LOZ61_001466 [Ophidiomyces ophidiicola]KAI1922184.1 hypothetical protein LOZ64_001297 [Ophidiomyces ophidiicola]KAI1930407.1 hypothetical protein LOZ60_000966 [Ophidiomyces ophidiicola]KAI1953751.1 hypothetical protein LOZ57_000092 [Ophidiomyces ophidiicola]KAI1954839.1 hypothetical protein LOZ62_000616 [Ophidiomyces ophidiicola]